MDFIKQNLKTILITTVATLGLILAVYLLGQRTFFKPQANLGLYQTITVSQTGADGTSQPVGCLPTESGQECAVSSQEVELNVNLGELERLAP